MCNKQTTDQNPKQSPRPVWWRLLGIRKSRVKWIPVVPSKWGWTLMVLFVLVGGMIGFAEYSMQPEFCRSCHLMEPYFQAWHESTHSEVPCGDCHFEPGWRNTLKGKWEASSQAVKFITNTYGSKPHAEVRDESCMREDCHSHRLLDGSVNWTVKSQRGHDIDIRFNHTPHLNKLRRGKQLRCVSCHSQMVQGKHIVVTLDSCFLCHFKGFEHGRNEEALGGCTACHEAPKENIQLANGVFNHSDYVKRDIACENCHADAISGDGEVPRQICWNCHNKPQQISRFGETAFIHDTHITKNKVECTSCHLQITHHLSANVTRSGSLQQGDSHQLADAGSCAQCHSQSHNGPAELYRGVGGRNIPDMPSPMYLAQVDCIACHRSKKRSGEMAVVLGQTFTAVQQACDDCHGNKYEGELKQWTLVIADMTNNAKTRIKTATQLFEQAELSSKERLELQRLLDDARHNIRLVELGHRVHNVTYATALLNAAMENCRKVIVSTNQSNVAGDN